MSIAVIEGDLSPEDARILTDKIKVGLETLWHVVGQAYQGRVWVALGYASWDEYVTRELGTSRIRLPREERQEVVGSLRELGLSTRAIATVTGLNRRTITKEVEGVQVVQNTPPEQLKSSGLDGKHYPTQATETELQDRREQTKILHEQGHSIRQIANETGVSIGTIANDLKPARQEPAKPKRPPLTNPFYNATLDLVTAAEKLIKYSQDDRFPHNKETITRENKQNIAKTVEYLSLILDKFNS